MPVKTTRGSIVGVFWDLLEHILGKKILCNLVDEYLEKFQKEVLEIILWTNHWKNSWNFPSGNLSSNSWWTCGTDALLKVSRASIILHQDSLQSELANQVTLDTFYWKIYFRDLPLKIMTLNWNLGLANSKRLGTTDIDDVWPRTGRESESGCHWLAVSPHVIRLFTTHNGGPRCALGAGGEVH